MSAATRIIDEARAVLERKRAGRPWPSLVVLLGSASGAAIDAVVRDAPAATRILVLEPVPAQSSAVLAGKGCSALIASGRLQVLAGPDYHGASNAWRMVDALGVPPLIVPDPALVSTHLEAVVAARRVFDKIFTDAHENAKARAAFAGPYLVNTLRNVPRMTTAPDLRAWFHSRRGVPAVVCGAGPSLNRNLSQLASRRDRVVLVVADTALRPALEAGLEPDFVVALDPSALNARHLSGLRAPTRTWLIAEAALDETAFESFDDRVAFFRVGANDPWPWLIAQGLDVPVLAAWGSVLTSTFEFATKLGCGPIAFMGADLSYSGGQPYCRGTMFEVDWARVVLEGQTLPDHWRRIIRRKSKSAVRGVDGVDVATAPHLLAFRDWFVQRAAQAGTDVFNLSGSGVLMGPSIVGAEASLFDRFPVAAIGPSPSTESKPTRAEMSTNRLDDDCEPMTGWIARCGASLDRGALHAALASLSAAPSHDVCAPVPEVRALTLLPEAVAIVRAAREGRTLPRWATDASAWADRTAQAELDRIVANLLSLVRLTRPEAPSAETSPICGHLQSLFALPWPQATFETAAALVIETANRLRDHPPAIGLRQRFRPQPAMLDASGQPKLAPEDCEQRRERTARLFLASLWTTAMAASTSDDPSWVRVLDAIDIAVAASADVTDSAVDVSFEASDRRWRETFHLSVDGRAELLRGGVFEGPHGGGVLSRSSAAIRVRIEIGGSEAIAWAPHRVLTDAGLPPSLVASPLADDRALVTPRGQLASFVVDLNGCFERSVEWPHPITGEIHGPFGSMAWTHGAPNGLMFRPSSGEVVFESIAFQPYSAKWWQDQIVLTSSTGVWLWTPGQRPIRIAIQPAGVIVSTRDRMTRIDPLPIVNGRLERRRLDIGWDVDLVTGKTTERALPEQGQAWSLAHHDAGIEAMTFPDADTIRLSAGPQRAAMWLTWPRPRTAVWLRDSLLVNTARGQVVLFSSLADLVRSGL